MNITQETISKIEQLYSVWYSDDHSNDVEPDKATGIEVIWEKTDSEEVQIIMKHLRTPKVQEVTVEWVQAKLGVDKVYKSFTDSFRKLLGSENSFNVYPTTYGIGIFVLFGYRDSNKKSKEHIDSLLNSVGIEYTNERSHAGWVYRYRISKSSENIKRIESFINNNTTQP